MSEEQLNEEVMFDTDEVSYDSLEDILLYMKAGRTIQRYDEEYGWLTIDPEQMSLADLVHDPILRAEPIVTKEKRILYLIQEFERVTAALFLISQFVASEEMDQSGSITELLEERQRLINLIVQCAQEPVQVVEQSDDVAGGHVSLDVANSIQESAESLVG